MIGIIDYGMGNLLSVRNALEALGTESRVCTSPVELSGIRRIILPGVGAFRDCMRNLARSGFIDALNVAVVRERRPFLGICLGMQAIAQRSFEGGEYEGLGWIDADVVRLCPSELGLRVPHIGWNEISYRKDSPLFSGLPLTPDFYFVHSYALQCRDAEVIEATSDYGGAYPAAIRKGNLFATQFHPEKSQSHGLTVLRNFLRWNPSET